MRGIGFFLGLISDGLRRHTSGNVFSLNGDGGNCLFVTLAAVAEYDLPSYRIGDLTEINAIGIGKVIVLSWASFCNTMTPSSLK